MTTHKLRATQSLKIYIGAIELCISVFENTRFLFSISITLTWIFEFWVLETMVENQAKQEFFCETHVFWELSYENWVIWSKNTHIQTGP